MKNVMDMEVFSLEWISVLKALSGIPKNEFLVCWSWRWNPNKKLLQLYFRDHDWYYSPEQEEKAFEVLKEFGYEI